MRLTAIFTLCALTLLGGPLHAQDFCASLKPKYKAIHAELAAIDARERSLKATMPYHDEQLCQMLDKVYLDLDSISTMALSCTSTGADAIFNIQDSVQTERGLFHCTSAIPVHH